MSAEFLTRWAFSEPDAVVALISDTPKGEKPTAPIEVDDSGRCLLEPFSMVHDFS
ncbi:hypothetical protein ACIBAI_04450 [Streptomyces sp. NPDC051041]|uniref:hypothetical protein n=1 Tax=Streptomyces sp. NPDC051041 TaxID=3365640 RepID=UPI00378EA80C